MKLNKYIKFLYDQKILFISSAFVIFWISFYFSFVVFDIKNSLVSENLWSIVAFNYFIPLLICQLIVIISCYLVVIKKQVENVCKRMNLSVLEGENKSLVIRIVLFYYILIYILVLLAAKLLMVLDIYFLIIPSILLTLVTVKIFYATKDVGGDFL